MIKVMEHGPWVVWELKENSYKVTNQVGGWMSFETKAGEDLEMLVLDLINVYEDMPRQTGLD